MRMNETVVIMKQKTIFPVVSKRALPEGKRFGSTLLTARLVRIRVMFDIGSKIESAMVVIKESEPEVTAP